MVTKVFPLVIGHQGLPTVTKVFLLATMVFPSVTKVFPSVTKVFPLVTKVLPLVIKVYCPLLTPLLWNDNQQTYSFEVEGAGGGTNEGRTHGPDEAMIVPFIVLDVNDSEVNKKLIKQNIM